MDRVYSIQRDFKSRLQESPPRKRWHVSHLATIVLVALAIGLGAGLTSHDAGATRGQRSIDTQSDIPAATVTAGEPADVAQGGEPGALPPQSEDVAWREVKVKRGDSLSVLFARAGLSPQELHEVLASGDDARRLRRIYPGNTVQFLIGGDSALHKLVFDLDEQHSLHVVRASDGFTSSLVDRPLARHIAHAHGVIEDSLFLAAQRAGLSENLTMELAAIFGWDVDFSLDIRAGDSFTVVYEELYRNGEKLRDGEILAAEFVNRGHDYRAIRYSDENGRTDYYTPDGHSMRKTFLRSPVDFTRISSRFSVGRRHPILNRIRAHKGVDYAAPRGTPVKAAGDGKIVFRGRKGGYGNAVIIQHGSRYSTLYGHLSGFARGVRTGAHVTQGKIIGYVGMTGLATGPHLHYEFRVNGVHRNPLTVHLPDAAPLPARFRDDFTDTAEPLLAQLDTIDHTATAVLANQESHNAASTTIALNRP